MVVSCRARILNLLRYPYGDSVANYDSRDGIGPLEQRTPVIELALLGVELNTVGTNESCADVLQPARRPSYACTTPLGGFNTVILTSSLLR